MTIGTVPRGTLLDVADELLGYARGRLAKAALPAGIAARDALVEPFAVDLAAYFDAMSERVLGTVRKALEIEWDPEDVDWTVETEELGKVLVRWFTTLGETAFAAVADQLGIELRFNTRLSPAKEILDRVGVQVSGIQTVSRAILSDAVGRSISAGESVDDLRGTLRDLFGNWSASRAQTIALSETATVYNLSATAGYREAGLVDEVDVFDGPECGWTEHDDPDLADGSRRSLDDADEYPTAHPNCQRAFGPVVTR